VYDGSLDAEEKVLTLNAEGPSCAGDGKLVKYKDAIEIKSHDHRVMTSHMLGNDGKWHPFMTANYRRKKGSSCLPHSDLAGKKSLRGECPGGCS
jgi:hypothetical protein